MLVVGFKQILLAKSVMNNTIVKYLCLYIFSLPVIMSCTSSSTSAEEVIKFGHPTTCVEDSERVLAEVQSSLDDSPRDEDILLATVFDQLVCQSERRSFVDEDPSLASEYIIPDNDFEGSLAVGFTGAIFEGQPSNFWLYVFSNGIDITQEVFANGNIVSLEDRVAVSIPFELEAPVGQAVVFDFLFLDSQFSNDQMLHRNSRMTRLVVHPNGGIGQYPNIENANSIPTETGATSDALIAAPPNAEGDVFETNLWTNDADQNVSFFPVSLETGNSVSIDCGQGQVKGFITSGIYADARSAVTCSFSGSVELSSLGGFVVTDFFAVDKQGRFFDSGLLDAEYQFYF